ncbi:unnamed protein product [Gongylonema pulchrum]|uniref:Uncharacterized protein n=1 Tax=Gongylonema pulchrum TaxID=637853 RepID=A0A183DUP5_9BILA|nr:unnamed protein product [Gongylonema pulchrum]
MLSDADPVAAKAIVTFKIAYHKVNSRSSSNENRCCSQLSFDLVVILGM